MLRPSILVVYSIIINLLYSVQNDMGEVYTGLQELPNAKIEIDEWRNRIEAELGSIVGSNGVKVRPILVDGVERKRVVIDINPGNDVDAGLTRVSDAIGSIAAASFN